MYQLKKWLSTYHNEKKGWMYFFTALFSITLLTVFSILPNIVLDPFLHVMLSSAIFITAIIIGAIALVSYFSQRKSSFLFIGIGYFGSGILEIQHIIFDVLNKIFYLDSRFIDSIFIWQWYAPRLFLAVLLWLSLFVNIGILNKTKVNEHRVYSIATIATSISFLVYFLFPLLPINSEIDRFPNYITILPTFLFLLTIIGYIKKGNRLNNIFQHWLINALILNFFADIGFNLNKNHQDNFLIDLSHFYIFLSYLLVFIGLIYYTYEKYKQVETNNRIIEKINNSLLQELNEKKQAQNKLISSQEKYRILVESSPDMIAVSQNKKWVYINQSGIDFLRAKSEKEIIGQPVFLVVAPDFHQIVNKRIDRILTEKSFAEGMEQKYRRLDGEEVDVEVQATFIMYNGLPSIQIVVRDITERKREEELLRQSEKLLAVGELAAGIAHEIRNPLTSLKGFTQLLQAGSNKKDEYFQVMLSELKSIDRVIGEFLLLAKPQKKTFIEADVNKILEEVVTLLHAQAMMNDVIIVEKKTDLPLVECEINQIKQMFTNVIKDSIEKTPNGGKLTIKTGFTEDEMVNIQINSQKNIYSEEDITANPIYYNDRTTAMGLMISCKIVQNHQGMIDFKTFRKKGTLVNITLPIHQPDKLKVVEA